MRKFSALLLLALLAPSCASSDPKEKATALARQTFESWVQVARNGDAEKTLDGCSDARKSEWLYALLEEDDATARRWRGELTGTLRTQLDLWWGVAHKKGNGREVVVSSTVLDHPSFRQLFHEFFMRTANAIREQFARLEVAQVYGDDTGVTILVKSAPGAPTELYGLIFERDGWKIDTYRQPLSLNR